MNIAEIREKSTMGIPKHRGRLGVVIHLFLLLATLVTLLPGPCLAAEFLVRTADEISLALLKASPGDTIVLNDGVWTDQWIRFEGNGTEQAPLVLRAQTPGQVVLTGNSRLEISGHWLVADGLRFEDGALESGQAVIQFTGRKGEAANSRLTNVAIVNYNPQDPLTRYFWVALSGQNNRVDHSRFEGQNHSGVTVVVRHKSGVKDGHIIEYNHFLNRPPGDGNGFETIVIGSSVTASSDSGTVVQSNLFERTNGEIEIVSVKSGGNDIRFNTFRQAAGAVTLRHGDGNRVTGNFFLGDQVAGSGGIRVIGSNHVIANNYLQDLTGVMGGAIAFSCGQPNAGAAEHSPVKNVIIAHNTFVENSVAAFKLDAGCGTLGRTERPQDLQFLNNLVAGNDSPFFDGQAGEGLVLAGNLFGGKKLFSGKKLRDIQPGEILAADPMLRLAPDNLWRPDVDSPSPAINAGAATGIFLPDMDGQERDREHDIGADEFSLAPIVHKPLSAGDVGPAWNK
jgi:poly(beta-D-mannuronate) lyase